MSLIINLNCARVSQSKLIQIRYVLDLQLLSNTDSRNLNFEQLNRSKYTVLKNRRKQHLLKRYATTAVTASLFHEVANEAGITIQDVMVRNDSACGSTIGPITSANLGMRVIDVGIPQLRVFSSTF